jgi:hypothetical protein
MRAISASIQASARVSDFVRREPGRVDGRADADGDGAAFLNKALRPQNSPEFSATGTTGVAGLDREVGAADLVAVLRPGCERVPSGK